MKANETEKIRMLCEEIENEVGRQMRSPRDFDWLAGIINCRVAVRLSPTTLKRTWGYLCNPAAPSRWTMDTLAQFAGYKDFVSYLCQADAEVQSGFLEKERIKADSLVAGQRLRIGWLLGRVCVVEYLGNGRFVVCEAKHTKLHVGDRFTCHLMIQGEPLYLDQLIHDGMEPVSYVAGKKDGVRIMME